MKCCPMRKNTNKCMKRNLSTAIAIGLLSFIVVGMLIYGAVAFFNVSLNPAQWDKDSRMVCSMLMPLFSSKASFVVVIGYYSSEKK